jgi:hypothetical protein
MRSPEEDIHKQTEELRKLQERVESLSKQLYRHTRDPYLIASQVFEALSFYREHYASGREYQERLQEILKILRAWGEIFNTQKMAVSIIAFAKDTPEPRRKRVFTIAQDEEDAIKEAAQELRTLPDNQDREEMFYPLDQSEIVQAFRHFAP